MAVGAAEASVRAPSEWSRLKVWIAPVVAVFGAGVSAAFLVAAKADRSELVEITRRIDELKTITASLDKSTSLTKQRVDFFIERLDAVERRITENVPSLMARRR